MSYSEWIKKRGWSGTALAPVTLSSLAVEQGPRTGNLDQGKGIQKGGDGPLQRGKGDDAPTGICCKLVGTISASRFFEPAVFSFRLEPKKPTGGDT